MSHRLFSQETIDFILQPNPLVAEFKQGISKEWQESSMTDPEIEVGGVYKTRSGRKATVLFKHPFTPRYVYVGWVERDQDIYAWDYRGYVNPGVCGDPNDLISEWKEPRKGEVWVNMYEASGGQQPFLAGSAYSTRAAAEWEHKYRADGGGLIRIAIANINWTEGQGLTDGEGSE